MRAIRHSLAIMVLLWLAGCAAPLANNRCTQLPIGGYCLQSSQAVAARSFEQQVQVTFVGRTDQLLTAIEVDQDGLRLVALTPLGQVLLQLVDNNREIKVERALSDRLEAVQIVGLLQMALWPATSVSTGLQGGLVLEESSASRRIMSGAQAVLAITYDSGRVPSDNYQLRLPTGGLTLDVKVLP